MRISIDFGITVTDTLAKSSNGNLQHHMMLSKDVPSEILIDKILLNLDIQEDIEHISLTGGKHKNIGDSFNGVPLTHVNEVDAIGEGAVSLSGVEIHKPSIIVNAGSGTACILAKDGEFIHCSGTGIGGGTVLGLSKLLLNTTDPEEIGLLAKQGNTNGVDLILEDVVSGPIGLLPKDTTAVNFGRVSKIAEQPSREDIAAGIINLVGQTAARIATSVALTYKATDIIVVGRTPTFDNLRTSLEQAALITNFTPHFPKNGEYASALGALIIGEK
jgi:type II pantothenate kinase